MNNFADKVAAEERLIVLNALLADADYAMNEGVLHGVLTTLGASMSADALRAHIKLLAELDLVSVEYMRVVGFVARLTRRGQDVAQGLQRVDGVARPRPGVV